MNPWGALEGRSLDAEQARYQGSGLAFDATAREFVASLDAFEFPKDVTRLEAHVVNGNRFHVAWDAQAHRSRLGANLREVYPVVQSSILQAARTLRPDVAVKSEEWMQSADAYYYDHHDKRRYPVYRIVYEDGERFYLDNLTGEVLLTVDTNSRLYRWLHYGLHRGDFAAWLRARPVWDFVMLILLAAVTTGALTGTWMGFRRIRKSRASAAR
jgi:hypothetical protein